LTYALFGVCLEYFDAVGLFSPFQLKLLACTSALQMYVVCMYILCDTVLNQEAAVINVNLVHVCHCLSFCFFA